MILPESVPIPTLDLSEEGVGKLVEEFLAKSPQGERRSQPRSQYRKIAVLVLLDRPGGDTSLMVLTENISQGGIAFKHPSSLEPDTPCKIKMMLPASGAIESNGKIVRCRPLYGGSFEIGLQFDQLLGVSFGCSDD